MSNLPFTLPKSVGSILSLLPQHPHSLLFTTLLNITLTRHLKLQDLKPLHGKNICICIKDGATTLHFSITPKSFVATRPKSKPDLIISANAYDFLMMGLRKEDPDTLFFNRRLTMEGDTELGLYVKNTLDALDLPPLDATSLLPAPLVALLKSTIRP
ncbi:ubiquinone anaerobic biosynthesis accessory factor UbiT [Sulfurirhabdus autotrophica]|uniref:Ubiquinone biosynthesis accessory factor UbiT n=1 Tax=Sulfurirhabdus autotrophica TaxID=1706046 RepID=A0A4R3XVQ8_9PROT|nr:SCP2 sterol-binding domain-containing protein [Sulfurirhabdus autotrophica]TCV83260.1 putative lipid carrier protein YhbT [Sulfurirhabdus autotrophica]